ncbi:UNVERIFIED_CONTAM: hypothetical protein K2H54_063976, partial [Gekko kuhli]
GGSGWGMDAVHLEQAVGGLKNSTEGTVAPRPELDCAELERGSGILREQRSLLQVALLGCNGPVTEKERKEEEDGKTPNIESSESAELSGESLRETDGEVIQVSEQDGILENERTERQEMIPAGRSRSKPVLHVLNDKNTSKRHLTCSNDAGFHFTQKQTEAEMQKIIWDWKTLCGFLEEQKRLLLGWLEGLAGDIVKGMEATLSTVSVGTHRPCQGGRKKASLPFPELAAGPKSRREVESLKRDDGFLELELKLSCFSERRAVLEGVLSRFKESLRLELENLTDSRAASPLCRRVSSPKQLRMETDAAELVQ